MTCYGMNETAIALLSRLYSIFVFPIHEFFFLRMQPGPGGFFFFSCEIRERRLTFFFVAKQKS